MGLDMYLYANKYLNNENVDQIKKLAGTNNLPNESGTESIHIRQLVGYWRKVNAVHGWFINKIASGVDECQELYISREQLEQLRQDCIVALANPERNYEIENQKVFYQLCDYLNKLETPVNLATYNNPVPPVEGFFFGGNELSDYYFSQLEYTIDLITNLLELDDDFSFHYQASW
jgi:hypothetical protein